MRARLVCALAALAWAGAAGATPSSFLDAASDAAQVVVGSVRDPARVDLHGYGAVLVVERSLSGGPPAGEAGEAGATLRIAWEQFDPTRPLRFRAGERWLVALDPFPGGSLWLARFPDALRGRPVWVVGARSSAALPDPDPASTDALAAWLALPEEARRAEPGARALAALVERAGTPLAGEAVARLDGLGELRGLVTGETAAALGRALGADGRPVVLRRAVAELAGRRRLEGLRPALEAAASAPGPVRADAIFALARLDGGLPADRARALLRDPDPRVRAAALRSAPDLPPDELVRLADTDARPEVRAAAIGALASRGDLRAADVAASALADPDEGVRAEAIRAVVATGAAAVPALRERAFAGSDDAAAAAAAALALTGPAGREALADLAERHPDERIRKAARFALTRQAGEAH